MRSLPTLSALRIFAGAVAGATLATGLSAQVDISAHSNVGVFARSTGVAALKFVAKDAKIAPPASVEASVRGATVATRVNILRSTNGVGVLINEAATLRGAGTSAGTTASSDSRNVVPGAHSFLVKMAAKEGAKFIVAASVVGRFEGRTSASGAVDIDNDGNYDWSEQVTSTSKGTRWLVTAGKTGLAIALQTRALAAVGTTVVPTSYLAALNLTITPADSSGRCTITRQGQSCGPLLAAAESQEGAKDILAFQTSNAQPGGVGIFILGDQALNVRFPGTRCGLYTNPLIQIGRVIDRQGKAELRFEIPKAFAGKFLAQDIIIARSGGRVSIESSNALAVACRKAN